jgi:hypothetical protein
MQFKIIVRPHGLRDQHSINSFEASLRVHASREHGDFWNEHYAWTDSYRSSMYEFNEHSRRWRITETINA